MKGMSQASRMLVTITAVLALAGVGAAGWYGYDWYEAAKNSSADAVDFRDGALRAARQLAATLQTVNSSDPEGALNTWEAAATGELLEQLKRDRGKNLDRLKTSHTSSTATVVETGLIDMDVSQGTATALAALDVSQSGLANDKPAPATTRQLRLKLSIQKTDAGWKASATDLIPS